MSEEGEEKESMLSKGFLDCEQQQAQAQAQDSDSKLTTCDLSSEFSAQCLLLSVANAVDNLPCNNRTSNASNSKEKEERSADEVVTTVSLMKKTYLRLLLAKKEFALYFDNQDHNDIDDNSTSQSSHKKYIDTSLTWLFLRCLVEIGDDDLCMQFLSATNNTLANLELDQERNNMDTHDDDGVISHLYLCSKRAELNKMTNSLRCLLLFCVDEMKKKFKKKHTTRGTTQLQQLSLGDLQRKLIQIGSTVSDVVKIFHDVHSFSSEEKKDVYSQEEYDWFAVEAYNRGVSFYFFFAFCQILYST